MHLTSDYAMESRKQPLKSLAASQAHNSINKNVNDDASVVLNIDGVDNTSVLLILYDELHTLISRGSCHPVVITQTMSGRGATLGRELWELRTPEL